MDLVALYRALGLPPPAAEQERGPAAASSPPPLPGHPAPEVTPQAACPSAREKTEPPTQPREARRVPKGAIGDPRSPHSRIVPTPCAECIYWSADPINPPGGLGTCAVPLPEAQRLRVCPTPWPYQLGCRMGSPKSPVADPSATRPDRSGG